MHALIFVTSLFCSAWFSWSITRHIFIQELEAALPNADTRMSYDDRWSSLTLQLLYASVLFWTAIVTASYAIEALGIGFRGTLPITVVIGLGSLMGIPWVRGVRQGSVLTKSGSEQHDHRDRWGIVAVGTMAGYAISYGILQLPMDWDSLAYHLPMLDHWIKSGTLANQDGAFWYVPGNNELLGLYFASMFDGDYLVQLHNLVPGTILLLAVLQWAGALRLSGFWTLAVLLSVFATQPVLRQLISAENDLGVVALVMAGAFFGFQYCCSKKAVYLPPLLACIGLLGGIKYYALAYVVLLTAMPIASLWLNKTKVPGIFVHLN